MALTGEDFTPRECGTETKPQRIGKYQQGVNVVGAGHTGGADNEKADKVKPV